MNKLANNATRLLEAISYQLIVTLEYCHNLAEGQTLWLEYYGDVTVEGEVQIEVKDFVEDLTDGHINFWNTLKNWMSPNFKQVKYSELILLTTQTYGAASKLRHWNQLPLQERLELLQNVLEQSEARITVSKEKPSRAVKAQQFVMAEERRDTLLDVIEKVKILSEEPDLVTRADRAKSVYGKGIHPAKRDDYFRALMGFLIDPDKSKNGWKITYEDFDLQISSLNAVYGRNSRRFPVVDKSLFQGSVSDPSYAERLFVKKLHEIEYATKVPTAILEHMVAVHTISSEFQRFSLEKGDIDRYKEEQLKRHLSLRAAAMRKCSREPKEYWCDESKNFFDLRCGESPDKISTFDDVTLEFRNGIWHMLADDEDEVNSEKLHWRLW
ncbi:hypothetical protein [Pseudomonas nitroreducens]|uniref:hypothetical protein n=1 Tax=Pseudomonas nitroreducens TaxID=46680 RepID=UPI000A075A7B|nr:hypothetical protein [Pseudomonas nitroreducens]NMZ61040.1 hypothetical protein [Pseudomonas nitroreducens]SNT46920.1 hypothetical protein SAMN05216209_5453 [Pseudomonas nitroreducens]